MTNETGKIIISIGVGILLIGLVAYFWGHHLRFLGNLPGDIKIERDNFRLYIPITTMILISIVINLIIRLFRFLFPNGF
jgi:uncharacterized membrane protein